ncbi:MAG: hypothetical protein R2751_20075 [Bacteroidales bacterium]
MDGERIATENITDKGPGRFIDVAYPIPERLVKGKTKVRVSFVPYEGHRAGPVFGQESSKVRIVRIVIKL